MGDSTPALDAVFEPVQRSTTSAETVRRLGMAIRLGVLAPGTQLPPERDLADQLCINRSTLRQALLTLAQSGHVVSRRGGSGGTFVADAPPLSLGPRAEPLTDGRRALLDHRVAIEVGATVLAAERAAPADLDLLDESIACMAAANTLEDFRRADVRFHIGVAQAAHSACLMTAMTELHGHISELVALTPQSEERLTRSNGDHRRLVTLLRRRNTNSAVLLMRVHIVRTERVLTA